MDKIIIKNMWLYGYHGVLSEENSLGQKFFIDIEMKKCLKKAGTTDALEESVSYAEVYERIEKIAKTKRFQLIESLAENIAMDVLENFDIEEVVVQVKKPEAPIPGHFDYVGVEITRKRDE